ncbi:MAG: bacteriocin immunity protein [Streptococcaceae bacterium]|jgi:hypothetical protein|nr:bacteriocin immunity protein [Streptococcaceae bacterium]
MDKTDIINQLYNLVLDRNIREWERKQLMSALRNIEAGQSIKQELSEVEVSFRPLALRSNLTPRATEFYDYITSTKLFCLGMGGMLGGYTGKK